MLIEKILQSIYEDGQQFQGLNNTSHLPDAPRLDQELQALDEAITDHLMVDQTNWEDFSRYPAEVWQRLKRDTFAAGLQGQSMNGARDFFGASDPEAFEADIGYVKEWLDKSIVLQPIHLGKGEQGIMRRVQLEQLAGNAGCYWNHRPSIGRWLILLADQQAGY
jgi:hypothetical protein